MATVLRPTPDAESDEKLELEDPIKQTQVDERSTDTDIKKAPQRKWGSLNPLRLQRVPPIPDQRQVTKEYGASLFSLVTFQWVYPLIKTGYLRELDIRDIWTVSPERSVDKLSKKVEEAFQRRKERGCKRPLLRALHGVFKRELWISWVCQMVQMATSLLAPFLSRYLISYAMEAEDARQTGRPLPHVGRGMGYAVGITLLTVVSTVCSTHSFYWGGLAGGQMKAALMSLIFSKAMRLSGHAKLGADNHLQQSDGKKPRQRKRFGSSTADDQQGWSNGRLLAIVGVDLERLERSCGTIHILWSVVTAVIVSFVVLMVTIGYSSLPSYGFLFAMVVASAYIIKIVLKYRRTMNKITDERITLTQEILQNVRFVKLFGWEGSFLQRFRQIRKREVKFLHKVVTTKHGAIVTTVSISSLAAMLSFITYAFTGHELTPDRIFAALGIFNALRGPFAILNMVISQATDAWAAIERIENLLLAEEREDYIAWERDTDYAIDIQHATFTWDFSATPDSCGLDKQNNTTVAETEAISNDASEQNAFRLQDIDLVVGNHELVAVIGAVGCGKSSLLSALASDMQLLSGSVRMGGTRAFCPQTAWIQNATVRDNILFGQEYDDDRYNEVLDACCLRPDLAILPDGDKTEVGERGITLSGGQKQRINIARAAYSRCDVVLMDDPLSAVDAHVGSRIMDEVICGLLQDRCRVLATHQLHVLGRCDRIVVMDDGAIHAIGTFEDLMKTDEVFQGLMSRVSGSADDDSNDDSPTGEVQVEQPVDTEAKNEKPGGALMQQEERATGSTGLGIWKVYLQSSGSLLIPVVALALGLVTGAALVGSGIWLSFWTSDRFPNMSVSAYAGIYAGISLAQVFILYLFALVVSIAGSISSRNMLQRAMHRVLRAPSSFFDTTPLGRITNRFSKDVDVLDEDLPDHIRIFLFMGVNVLGTAILAIYFFHYFALVVVAVIILAIVITMYYRPGSRSVRRYEAVLRSAVVSRFTEAIHGTSNIQAYKRETHFQQTFHMAIDSMNGARFITLADQRWSAFWVNTACCLLVLATGVLIASLKFGVSSSSSGLVLSYMLVMSSLLVLVLRQFSECQSGMTSVERLHHYGSSIEQEAPLHLDDVRPGWPETGRITFTNAQMRYREELPLVLQGLSMDIHGGERIGIVGRTGAGKSSIMATLFRLVELTSGSIKIDDVDITTVGLQDLRTRLTIIPQDPTLFKGTIRSNLDPFHEHTDLELWSALRKAHLIGEELPDETSSEDDDNSVPQRADVEKTTKAKRLHLDTPVEEDGSNFSLGQRQLMALARALVRDSRIIICDEATSSVDLETDAKVQETMARGFQGKTLLCIAHRLRTIIHYDRICVMDKGQIAEMDTPLALWEQPGGIFRGMCEQSGITREDFYASSYH